MAEGTGNASEIRNLTLSIDALRPHPRNYKNHPEAQLGKLSASIARFGQVRSVVVQEGAPGRYLIVAGHGFIEAAKREHLAEIRADVIPATWDDDAVLGYLIADNETGNSAEDDLEALAALLQEQANAGYNLESLGSSQDELDTLLEELAQATLEAGAGDGTGASAVQRATLADRFIVPPFSVLDARQGYWQERKRQWLALGIQSELGRGENSAPGGSSRPAMTLGPDGHTLRGDGYGRPLPDDASSDSPSGKNKNGLLGESEQARSHYKDNTLGAIPPNERDRISRSGSYSTKSDGEKTASFKAQGRLTALQKTGDSRAVVYGTAGNVSEQSGTSIFDPVLCELVYRWFCPPTGLILDPFAGGSVRGIVAARLGRGYVGVDLRAEQVEANEAQLEAILSSADPVPQWIIGDSRNLTVLASHIAADLVFTCPPYYDLEVYSDDPHDLSTAGTYQDFLADYRTIVAQSLARLKPDRFACVVVGDIRDPKGFYRNFVADSIAAFQDAGAKLYNEAILVTSVGSLPIRVGRQFSAGRKLGKTHQNVLVFCKGDPRKAVEACGPVEVSVLEEMEVEQEEALAPAAVEE